jgi:hypothetical protein
MAHTSPATLTPARIRKTISYDALASNTNQHGEGKRGRDKCPGPSEFIHKGFEKNPHTVEHAPSHCLEHKSHHNNGVAVKYPGWHGLGFHDDLFRAIIWLMNHQL